MAREVERTGIPFTDIHINLTDQTIVLKKDDEVVATLIFEGKFPSEGVIFFPNQLVTLPTGTGSIPEEIEPVSPAPTSDTAKEREKTITLSGKLKSQPKPGKPDRSGKPTAYADFAAHVEGEKSAHDYVATFHRHTRQIALILPKETPVTITGYPYPSQSEKRKDTFSVISIVDYPGKPPAKPKKR